MAQEVKHGTLDLLGTSSNPVYGVDNVNAILSKPRLIKASTF